MRHRASTALWEMDVGEEDINCFMEHIGHHKLINKHIYACPPALRVMQTVTPLLERMDPVRIFDLRNCFLCYLFVCLSVLFHKPNCQTLNRFNAFIIKVVLRLSTTFAPVLQRGRIATIVICLHTLRRASTRKLNRF